MSTIELQSLTKAFGDLIAVNDVSLAATPVELELFAANASSSALQ